MSTNWIVRTTRTVDKQVEKLSEKVKLQLRFLFIDLANKGPALPNWPNYSKLHGKKGIDKRHCYLQRGKPTYVCCWK